MNTPTDKTDALVALADRLGNAVQMYRESRTTLRHLSDSAADAVATLRHLAAQAPAAPAAAGGETVAWAVYGEAAEYGPVLLPDYCGSMDIIRKRMMEKAQREGFKGSFVERMAELGWWVEPLTLSRPAADSEAVYWQSPDGRVMSDVDVRFDGTNTLGWKQVTRAPAAATVAEYVKQAVAEWEECRSPLAAQQAMFRIANGLANDPAELAAAPTPPAVDEGIERQARVLLGDVIGHTEDDIVRLCRADGAYTVDLDDTLRAIEAALAKQAAHQADDAEGRHD